MSNQRTARAVIITLMMSFLFIQISASLLAQTESGQPGSSFKMRVDVDLVTIELTALDKDGKAVRNLQMKDFRLYEDGKKQDLLSFDEVSAGVISSPKELPLLDENAKKRGKTVLIVFMENTISPGNVKLTRDSAIKFVRQYMRPQDLFAVMSFAASMKIHQNLTSERDEVLAALDKFNFSAVVSFAFDDLLRTLEQISYSISRIKGQKSVLIFGPPELGYTPMDRERYIKAVDAAKQANVVIHVADPERSLSGRAMAGALSPGSLPNISGGASGGSLRGGGPMGGAPMNLSGGLFPVNLRNLAHETGGSVIDNILNLDSELERLDQRISNYYVLGFQSNNPKHDGSYRKIEVKTDIRGLALKYRDSYPDRNPIDVLASSRQEKNLLSVLASPGEATRLPVVFRPLYFYESPKLARVVVSSKIRTENISLRKKSGRMGTDLNIMGVAYAADGATAARFSETLPVTIDKESEVGFRKEGLSYRNYFRLRPGKYRLRLAVSDDSGNIGSVEQELEIPLFPEQGFACSSLVMAEQMSRLPDLVQNLNSQMLDQSDPLIYSGLRVEPGVDHKLPLGSAVRVVFRLYNLQGRPEEWTIAATPRLRDLKGAELSMDPIALKKAILPVGNGEAAVGLTLPFKGAAPGKYTLIIDLLDPASSRTSSLRSDLEFVQ